MLNILKGTKWTLPQRQKIMQPKVSIVLRLRNFALNKSPGNETLPLSFCYLDKLAGFRYQIENPLKKGASWLRVWGLSDTEMDFTPRFAT